MAAGTYGLRLLRKPAFQRLIFAFLGVAILALRVVQFVYWTGQRQWAYDFAAYWTAARHLLDGQPIYQAFQLAGPYSAQANLLYLNPPILATLVTPLAVLFPGGPSAANWIWIGVGAAILVWAMLALVRSERLDEAFPFLRGRGRWLAVAIAIAFPPVVDELVVGNTNMLLLGLMTATWLGVRRGGPSGEALAGSAVGAATLLKIFPGVLVLWFVLTRRWRAAAWSIVAAGALAAASLPLTGLQPWLDYPRVLANLSLTTEATDALAPTFWLAPYLGFALARLLVTAAGLAILAWAALPALGALRAGPRDDDRTRLGFAIAVVVSILITPALYTSYLTVLLLPLALGAAARRRLGWLAIAYLLMWGGVQPALGDFAWIVTRGLPTAGALLLLAILARVDRTTA
jgi:hypothetical protein